AVGDKSLAECYWSHTGAVEPTDGIGSTGEAVNKMHLDEGVWIADGYMGSLVDILNSYVSDNVNPADPLRRYVKWTHSDAILIHGTTLVNVVKGGVNYPAWIGLNDSALSFKDAAPPESDFGYNLRLDGKVHKAAGKNVSLAEIDGYFAQSSGWSYKGSFLTFNEIKEYSVSISIKGNGSVSVDGTKAAENNSWAEPNTTVVKVKDDGSSNLLEFTAASARYEFSLLTVNDVDVTCGPYSLNGINADTTVSAQFKQVQFTVTYQFTNTAPSGTALPEPVNTEYEGVVDLTRPTVPTGYSFSGWSFEDEVAASVKVTYDVTVTGSWTHNQWEVTYTWTNPLPAGAIVPNGAVLPDGHTGKHYQDVITLSQPAAVTGYTFQGWCAGTEACGTTLTMPDGNIVLNGSWKANVHTATFNGNGSTVAYVKAIQQIFGNNLSIPSDIPVRTGYEFSGWYGDVNDESTKVDGNTTFNVDSDVDYYAKWAPMTCNAKFTDNYDGSSYSVIVPQVFDEKIAFPGTEPVRRGFYFDGWYSAASGKRVTAETVFDNLADTVFTAAWKSIPCAATFVGNFDGSEYSVTLIQKYGSKAVIPDKDPARDNCTFAGWFSTREGGVRITGDYVYDVEGSTTYYARWTGKTVTVPVDGNSAPGAKPLEVVFGGTELTGFTAPVLDGAVFEGYWSGEGGSGQLVIAADGGFAGDVKGFIEGGRWVGGGSVKLYAKWGHSSASSVIYHGNGGLFLNGSEIAAGGTAKAETPVREGYGLLGWSENRDAAVPEYSADVSGTQVAGKNLYAIWEVNNVTERTGAGSITFWLVTIILLLVVLVIAKRWYDKHRAEEGNI
nr:InlB B-repeat-containing protein [Candidatus Methanomethylophilaceae archaeon]